MLKLRRRRCAIIIVGDIDSLCFQKCETAVAIKSMRYCSLSCATVLLPFLALVKAIPGSLDCRDE